MNKIAFKPQQISVELLNKLDAMGLIKVFRPTNLAAIPPKDENIAESIYESSDHSGPHKLICVGVNKTKIKFGIHKDHEDFLIPVHNCSVKPVYLVISHLSKHELYVKARENSIKSSDFTCMSLYPAPRGAEMFTMLKDTVHCELTTDDAREIGCFYVTESRDLTVEWVEVDNYEFSIKKD